jgi:hypothetical protein
MSSYLEEFLQKRSVRHSLKGAMKISNVPDDDIVTGVPAKSIKHKVKTDMKFLMAGQRN